MSGNKTVKMPILEDDGICPRCGGILKGYVGIEGEWPCECDFDGELEAELDKMIDGKIDEYLMRKKGIEP